MCVFVSRPMTIVTFLLKNDYSPKRVVDFHRERDTFRNKIMEIVEEFGKNYNSNGKPWKSSRILREKPNFFTLLSSQQRACHHLVQELQLRNFTGCTVWTIPQSGTTTGKTTTLSKNWTNPRRRPAQQDIDHHDVEEQHETQHKRSQPHPAATAAATPPPPHRSTQ